MLGPRRLAASAWRKRGLLLAGTTRRSTSTSGLWTTPRAPYQFGAPAGLPPRPPPPPPAGLLPSIMRPLRPAAPPACYATSGKKMLGHLAVAPFLLGTLGWSYFFTQQDGHNEELVAACGRTEAGGDRAQIMGLFALYRYLEIATDGPCFDMSDLAALIDWPKLMALAPTQPALGLVWWGWATMAHPMENSVALFPSVDIKPKLVRLGVLEKLEEGLGSAHPTVQLCAAYVLNRLVRNQQVARMVAARPAMVQGLVEMVAEEVVVENHRFQGFVHSESNTSAEVFVILLDTLTRVLEATLDKDPVILIGGSGGHHPVVGSPAVQALACVSPVLVEKAALVLRHLELCDEHVSSAQGLFKDHHISIRKKFFPGAVDDQLRRRMREVEAEVARFLGAISKDEEACDRLLLTRDVLQGLAPLAVTEARNASAFLPAIEGAHNILDRYAALTSGYAAAGTDHEELLVGSHSKSLLADNHLNHRAVQDAMATVADREEGTLGRPFARLRSVYAMRCYTSSMACLVVGGVYGVLRTAAANPLIHPVLAYSVNGVGAVLLNMGWGIYGLRNWQKQHTYIEDDTANAWWTAAQTALDVGIVTALVRRHPYALLPMVRIYGDLCMDG